MSGMRMLPQGGVMLAVSMVPPYGMLPAYPAAPGGCTTSGATRSHSEAMALGGGMPGGGMSRGVTPAESYLDAMSMSRGLSRCITPAESRLGGYRPGGGLPLADGHGGMLPLAEGCAGGGHFGAVAAPAEEVPWPTMVAGPPQPPFLQAGADGAAGPPIEWPSSAKEVLAHLHQRRERHLGCA